MLVVKWHTVVFEGHIDHAELDQCEAHFDRVMEELCKLPAVDGTMEFDRRREVVRFYLEVAAKEQLEAASAALVSLRTAIQAAGGGTPDWESIRFPEPDGDESPEAEDSEMVPA